VSLPVLDAASRACSSCHGPCCFEYTVPVSGYDVWRLSSGLGVPWSSLVELDFHTVMLYDGFRLDRGPKHWFFKLKRRESGACLLLVELDDTHRRCGAHALRPGPCRRYPLFGGDGGVELVEQAICPAPQAAMYRAAAVELAWMIDEPERDRALYHCALGRWDQLARVIPVDQPRTVDQFLDWIARVYQAIEPLRHGPRADWQPRAEALAAAFPLPAA
jgi:hypothetical protein